MKYQIDWRVMESGTSGTKQIAEGHVVKEGEESVLRSQLTDALVGHFGRGTAFTDHDFIIAMRPVQ